MQQHANCQALRHSAVNEFGVRVKLGCPPRPDLFRVVATARAQASGESQRDVTVYGRWQESLATLETGDVDRPCRIRKSRGKQDRKHTPRQRTIWQAVPEARLRCLSLRPIARELDIYRETAGRYTLADSPAMRRTTIATLVQQPDCAVAAYSDIFLGLPRPYEVVLVTVGDKIVEVPWDFARHNSDAFHRSTVVAIASPARQTIGK